MACYFVVCYSLFTFGGWIGFSSPLSLSIFFLFSLDMSRELRLCPGVGDEKCGAFLSTLDRDPHPTCARCRGKICTKDLTCDFCAAWSAEQWDRFTKKRSHKERKKHRPSGSVSPAQQTSPRAETFSGVSRPGTSSSSSSLPSLQGGRGSRGDLRVHLVLCLEGLPLLPLDLGPARGVGVPLGIRLGREGALPPLLLLREWERGELPSRCRRPFPAPPISVSLPNSHRTFHDVGIRERHRNLAPACYPPVVPDLRIEDQGRIRGLGHVRVARVDVVVVLALAPLPVRGQEDESVGVGHRPRRSLLVPARTVSGRGLRNATVRGVTALGLDVTALDPRIDIGHAVTAFDVTGRGLLTTIGHAVSVCIPLPAGESGVNARVRPPSRTARVTARGLACDYLALLTACGLRRQDGWPDEKPRRVWRRLPRSLLWFLKRRRSALLLQEGWL